MLVFYVCPSYLFALYFRLWLSRTTLFPSSATSTAISSLASSLVTFLSASFSPCSRLIILPMSDSLRRKYLKFISLGTVGSLCRNAHAAHLGSANNTSPNLKHVCQNPARRPADHGCWPWCCEPFENYSISVLRSHPINAIHWNCGAGYDRK